MKFALIGLCSLMLSLTTHAKADSKEEALLGVRISSQGITYYVYSGGCTYRKDFKIELLESYPVQIQLLRTRTDACERLVPDGVEIFFSWDEIGLEKGMPFRIRNPLQTFVVPG